MAIEILNTIKLIEVLFHVLIYKILIKISIAKET